MRGERGGPQEEGLRERERGGRGEGERGRGGGLWAREARKKNFF